MQAIKRHTRTNIFQQLRIDFNYLGVACWLGANVVLFGFTLTELAIGLFISSGLSLLCGCLMRAHP
ncbi:hypothetical protein [Motilimonas sp. KMU-193]|uniref:hypothetical protein n=1 Tax=Motilimonas sp. KMU-193 TaxID=3388668 RepID=UPI00396B00F0